MNILFKRLLSGLSLALCIISTGCAYTQGTFDNMEQITQYQPYDLPVKFYVEDIIFIKGRNGATCFLESEAGRWKRQLVKHYPEIFSETPEKALNVKFSFYVSNYAENVPPYAPALLLLSLPTGGIFPVINNFDMESYLETKIENQQIKQPSTLKFYCRGNIGILGAILPTRYLLPSAKVYFFTSKNLNATKEFAVEEHKMKSFLRVFVAQIHRFSKKQIWQLYIAKHSDSVKMLD